nr:AraC family transcriptional regulator [Actinomycetota bacterium]
MTHRVAVLAIDQAVGYDLTIASLVFGASLTADDTELYDTIVCGVNDKPVRMSTGFTGILDHGPEA